MPKFDVVSVARDLAPMNQLERVTHEVSEARKVVSAAAAFRERQRPARGLMGTLNSFPAIPRDAMMREVERSKRLREQVENFRSKLDSPRLDRAVPEPKPAHIVWQVVNNEWVRGVALLLLGIVLGHIF